MSYPRIALSWSIGQFHGWGLYGLNLVFAMLRQGIEPILLYPPNNLALNPLEMYTLLPVLEHSKEAIAFLARHPHQTIRDPEALLLHHTNGMFTFAKPHFRGQTEVGITFLESTQLAPDQIAYARTLPLIITGSRWNERILKEYYGLTNVGYLMQGIDSNRFLPTKSNHLLPGRFVIFSGGKLEYRKGQDLVIAAFQKFHARHPEAFLVTAWSNKWLSPASRFASRWVQDLPENNDINTWLGKYLPSDSYMDVGDIPNPMTPSIMQETHVGLFPNRCEGGTNLVAMEYMAMGLPIILANNTGHQELINPTRCYPLTRQTPCISPNTGEILTDWGESSLDEILAHLETIYSNHEEAMQKGANASRFIREYSWNRQCEQFLTLLATL